jgi:nucleotidyltransferase substrate binding protein (TIGR01987 family)
VTERLLSARRALKSLEEVSTMRLSPVVARDLAILRFTYTFEPIWKACQAVLNDRDALTASSPKTAIRSARQVGALSDADCAAAIDMANDRNLAAHVYNEAIAQALYARMPHHVGVLGAWLRGLEERMNRP